MLNRVASTQYNDWTGGVALDDADIESLSDYARKKGFIGSNDVIYGFEASYNHLTKEMMVTISYSHLGFDDFKSSNKKLLTKSFDLPASDFLDLFKRINMAVAKKGI